ncbi:MAG: EAL domain-containing protein [Oscillospiraceae bacterium]|nr:EAL domain-containing protein [Oscillospiraceae bacterium]
MSRHLNALNRAFEKAFAHTASRETLSDLLSCLGEELLCDRISIFEINADGTCDNTYEWCHQGTISEKDLLQNLPVTWLGHWKEKLANDEIIVHADLDEIREEEPEIWKVFHDQQVHAVIVSKLAFHGQSRGFFVLENPGKVILDEADEMLPGMRYILSSLVYSDYLIHKLEKIGYSDNLTGTGNRLSLHEHLETLDRTGSIGMIYCDVFGWNVEDGRPEHMEQEQMLIHASEILENVFDESEVFRVSQDEFLVVVSPVEEALFLESEDIIRRLFLEKDLLVAIGAVWDPVCKDSFDAMIRRTHLVMYDEKRALLEEHKERTIRSEAWDEENKANVALYHAEQFFQKAEAWSSQIFDENIMTVVIDVNYFKLFNDIFGRKAGNVFLESIGEALRAKAHDYHGIAGYLGGDNFILMLPVRERETEELRPYVEQMITDLKYTDGFTPVLGVYLSDDREENVSVQYDRALTALSEIKGSYTEHYHFYSEENYRNVRENKLLLLNARKGIRNGEFIFYVQPQVHERTGRIVGSEALVRWNLREQVLTPDRFIEILEKSGHIFALDCCVWEQVCAWQKSLEKRGLPVLPCSVNVSRVDFYFTDVGDYFINLVKKYDLNPALLGIEITESAFTDNTESIGRAVKKLHEAGFRISMDDFGSGSSSLSMLHTMNLDVLKTDVKFMSQKNSDSKAISIVESVISMAHMIGMLVVTEGVETQQQRDELIALGDNYAQGFFFYKPMPVEEYEALLQDKDKLGEPPKKGDSVMTSHIRFRDMIHEGMLSETLLDNIIGPAAIYKECGGEFSIVQVNTLYTRLTGITQDDTEAMKNFVHRFHSHSEERVTEIFHGAESHPLEGSAGEVDFEKPDGTTVHMKARVFLLYSCDDHSIYMTTFQ